MNVTTVSTGTSTSGTSTLSTKGTPYKIEMLDDGQLSLASDEDDDDLLSSDGSLYGDNELVQISVQDDVANQLAAAGPVGVAAAAAIASSKKRKRPHSFETNPSVRKRQQNRLLRKLRGIIYEFTGRVGKQAVVLVATPGKPNTSYKVFGAKPLEDVVRNLKNIVMDELENALAQQAPPPPQEDPTLFELPPLIIDGIPTPVEKMTQAQLRAFIPLMLKYSTGRGKPGWGRESTRPPWWPKELPWANVRMDARSEDDKQKISWTHALRKIVINCYKYHGREDLLPTFADDEDKVAQLIEQSTEIDEDDEDEDETTTTVQTVSNGNTHTSNYTTQTVLSTIQNADGTVSLIQVDPNNPIITLPDGTTAQVQGVATLHQGEGGATIQTVQSLSDLNGHENMTVDLTEATVAQDGQIYITAEDGQGYPVSVSNMITVPVSASMYQSMMANIQQIHTNSDGTVCITPMQVDSHNNNSNNNSSNNLNNINSNSNNTNSNSHSSNNNNNNNNHYQCYSIVTSSSGNDATPRLFAISQGGQAYTNQTNIVNNNNHNNNVNNNNNNNHNNNNINRNNCQIIQTTNLGNNSSQQNQNLQQNIIGTPVTKFLIASNLSTNLFSFNTAGNIVATINNNNNNEITLNNNTQKIASGAAAATIIPLPIVRARNNSTAIVKTKRSGQKRRKQSFNKVTSIKIEDDDIELLTNTQTSTTTTTTTNTFQNTHNAATENGHTLDDIEVLAAKTIKIEKF